MRARFPIVLLPTVAVLALAACGAIEETSHCDFRPKEYRCQERRTLPTSTTVWEATCKAIPNSIYRSGGCPKDGKIGGCDQSAAANPVFDWYYADATGTIKTAADVMKECAGKPYLAP
ncbi:MAG: hypothetical protein EXR72_02915 [Myxococcales bacterium]|nr:hypothetical protein [Myxococcales bacterium]